MKKISIYTLILVIMVISTGCGKVYFTTGLGNEYIFQIEGEKCTYSEAFLYLAEEKRIYEASFGSEMWSEKIGDTTLEEYVKDLALNKLVKIESINLLAKEKGIILSAQEKEQVNLAANEFYTSLSEDEVTRMNLSIEIVTEAYEKYALSEKTFNEITKVISSDISDSDAKVIKVQSIFIKEDLELANEIYDKASSGEDFYELAVEYSEDDMIEYEIKKGETIEDFEEEAYDLKAGEMSRVVETEKGYYIIKCISDYMVYESSANKTELLEKEKQDVFKEEYNPFVDTLKYTYNKKTWEDTDVDDIVTLSQADFYGVYNKYCK